MTGAGGLTGVILDVGGTLWPDIWESGANEENEQIARVAPVLGLINPALAADLVRRLSSSAETALQASYRLAEPSWDVDAIIAREAAELGLPLEQPALLAVRRAMALPAGGRIELLPNAMQLLATVKALGLRCGVLSNTVWRDQETYWQDFSAFGIARFVDAIVTSLDAGARKPSRRAFEMALTAIDCDPAGCVMIGDSEDNDIAPALRLGMRTIRVAIERPLPAESAAHAIVGSLHGAAEILRSWLWS